MRVARLLVGAAAVLVTGNAAAESGLESPSLGVNQMSRGGAWLARADDPLATYFNPAAIVRNPTGVHLGAQLMFRSQCLERADIDGQPVAPGGNIDTAPPGEVCANAPPFPNPQLAATFRIHKQLGLGLAVLGPHAAGNVEWEPTVRYTNRFGVEIDAPNPVRYLMLENDAILLFPTLSLSYAPIKSLSFGAGFTWGIADFGFSNVAEAASPARCANPALPCPSPGNPQPDDFLSPDIYARVEGFDGFVPGFVASVLYSPIRQIDLAAWYRFSDAIRSDVDLRTLAPYYNPTGTVNESATPTDVKNAGTFELAIPMEARIGFRYHHPRAGAQSQDFVTKHRGWARDAFSQDLFDIEIDGTWAHNSQVDEIDIQLRERYVVNGTPNGRVPLDASIPHPWKDVFGVRLGGEYIPIPDFLAVRLGGFFESRGVSAEYLHVDFHLSERVGVAGGAALRLGPVDISVAYQHTFFFPLDNGGDGRIKTITGDATTGDFRTRQTVNGGRATASLDEVGLSLTYNYFLPTL